MPAAATKKKYQNTTLRVPKKVYDLAKNALSHSVGSSFNEFVVEAIEEKLRCLREAEIDAAFAHMAEDADYQCSSIAMAQEFEKSDGEAFKALQGKSSDVATVDLMQKRKPLGNQERMEAHSHARTSKARSG